jgi:hypothetical protein
LVVFETVDHCIQVSRAEKVMGIIIRMEILADAFPKGLQAFIDGCGMWSKQVQFLPCAH